MWTQFHDMHSGGGQKLAWARIYIEAPEREAAQIRNTCRSRGAGSDRRRFER